MPPSKKEKIETVEKIKRALANYPVVAVATLQSLPSRQYNAIKKKLRGKAELVLARSTLVKRAIDEAKPELKELEKHFEGSTALLFTQQNPFELFKTLKQSRTKTAAKPGQMAPSDLIVPAGETNLAPGPVLTELKQAGISAKIQGPKVIIDKDALVAKKGEAISEAAAKILAKLGVEPIEVGLKVTAAWEKGVVYASEVLDIDEAQYVQHLQLAHRQAVNLGVYAEIFNAVTTPLIIAKAAMQANALQKIVEEKSEQTPQQEQHATQESEQPAQASEQPQRAPQEQQPSSEPMPSQQPQSQQ